MNTKNLLIVTAALATSFLACTKSSNSTTKNQTTGISGRYGLYRVADSFDMAYTNNMLSEYTLINEWASGDTLYSQEGTPNVIVQPNSIVNYNFAVQEADTLSFNSDGTGTEYINNSAVPFNYSLQSKSFTEPHPIASYYIVGSGNNQFELDEYQGTGTGTQKKFSIGLFYKKL
jgi:hypothetical protein